jgi:hypothetical protein
MSWAFSPVIGKTVKVVVSLGRKQQESRELSEKDNVSKHTETSDESEVSESESDDDDDLDILMIGRDRKLTMMVCTLKRL